MKWEYRLLPTALDREEHVIEETLNSLGKDGWGTLSRSMKLVSASLC